MTNSQIDHYKLRLKKRGSKITSGFIYKYITKIKSFDYLKKNIQKCVT